MEVEQALGAVAVPDERVERRQESCLLSLVARAAGPRTGQDVSGLRPALHRDWQEAAFFDQLVDSRTGGRRPDPEVVGQVCGGCHPQALKGECEQVPRGLVAFRGRLVEKRVRDHALG
jgi:hypothetical protein